MDQSRGRPGGLPGRLQPGASLAEIVDELGFAASATKEIFRALLLLQPRFVESDLAQLLTGLTRTAARKTPVTEDQPEQSASFSRSLSIPAEVSADQVSATYENGVLTVTLPKREEAKPKKITVAVK